MLNPDVLSHVIEKVADEEFERLSTGLTKRERASCIEHALSELHKLQKGESPDYDDEWVALLYLTWYWIRQFNLCHEIFKDAMADLPPGNPGNRLHVVDFGSGPLTAQFAALLAFGNSVRGVGVYFDSFDKSEAMLGIGKKMWKCAFVGRSGGSTSTERSSNWKGQRTGVSLIGLKSRIGMYRPWKDGSDSRRLLTAFHVFYGSTQERVRSDLATLKETFQPHMYIATTTSKSEVMARVSPFGPASVHPKNRPGRILLSSERITTWRRRRLLSDGLDLGNSAERNLKRRVPMWDSNRPPEMLMHKV